MGNRALVLFILLFYFFFNSTVAVSQNSQDKYVSIQHFADPYTLNPVISTHVVVRHITSQLFAPLVIMNAQRQPEPYLAKSWVLSPDHKSITLNLVDNAKFHDGHALTAEDVEFSINMVKKHHPFRNLYEHLEKIEIINPTKLTLHLSKPHPAIFYAMSSPFTMIMPKHIYDDGQAFVSHPKFNVPVGSGPYQFESWQPNEEFVVKSFADFFLGKPEIAGIRFVIASGFAKLFNLAASLDLLPINIYADFKILQTQYDKFDSNQTGEAGYASSTYLTINTEQTILSDKSVRKAMALALDRDILQQSLANPKSKKVTGAIHPLSPFYQQTELVFEPRLKSANQLLDQAGYLRGNDGLRFSLTLLIPPHFANASQGSISMVVKRNLAKLGISLQLEHVGFKEAIQRTSDGDYQLTIQILHEWGDPLIGLHRQYHSKNIAKGIPYSNNSNYSNKEVDELLDLAAVTVDFDARYNLYARLQTILADEVPQISLTPIAFNLLYDKNLTGIPDTLFGLSVPMEKLKWK